MKTVKSRLFRKYLKRRKSWVGLCLSLDWISISEKKIENCNSVGTRAHKVGKVLRFRSKVDPYFPDIWRV